MVGLGHDGRVSDSRPSRPLRIVVAAVVLVLVGAVGGVFYARAQHLGPFRQEPQDINVFAERQQYADPDSRTAQAAAQAEADGNVEEGAVFSRLAAIPSGIWLTPEQHPPGEVGVFVGSVVQAANEANRAPLFVIYGIPDRDCSGGFSEGGLSVAEYGPWVQEIATAAAAAEYVAAVLEPDALAAALECDARAERVELMSAAVDRLRAAGVTTYVDGGHSDWVSPARLAGLMREVGVESVRGFSTNVSNYQSDDDERRYAEGLSKRLGGVDYVIDNGRNGNGSLEEWCNPPGRALGNEPGFVDDGTHLDAFLWVKPPGESDGECRGGPAAGEFWPERAMELAAASGW